MTAMNPSRNAMKFGLLVALLAAALGGCASTETKLWSYDEATEVKQAQDQHEAIVARVGVYPDETLSRYVAEVGARLAAASERPGLKWQFTVLDSPRPGAFATRGGYVYITRGMLALLRSEDDLAAVLAHEISHISTRDAMRAEIRGNVVGAGSTASAVALPFVTFLIEPYARSSEGLLATMRNSSEEFEADRRGVEDLRRAQYAAESMPAVMEIFANIEAYDLDHDPRLPSARPYAMLRFGIYADDLMRANYELPAGDLSPTTRFRVAAVEAFNRNYGRPSLNAWYRCFAFTPSPETRRYLLDKKESWTRVDADPEFLARLDGLEIGPGRKLQAPAPDGQTNEARKPIVLRIHKVQKGDTFTSLANTARVPNAATVLRVLNQRYPSGKLEVGQLVKVIE